VLVSKLYLLVLPWQLENPFGDSTSVTSLLGSVTKYNLWTIYSLIFLCLDFSLLLSEMYLLVLVLLWHMENLRVLREIKIQHLHRYCLINFLCLDFSVLVSNVYLLVLVLPGQLENPFGDSTSVTSLLGPTTRYNLWTIYSLIFLCLDFSLLLSEMYLLVLVLLWHMENLLREIKIQYLHRYYPINFLCLDFFSLLLSKI
jgi:hypothetical protein